MTRALPAVPQEVAMQVVNSVVFSLLVFYVVRLQGAFTIFWLVYLITSCCGVSVLLRLTCTSMLTLKADPGCGRKDRSTACCRSNQLTAVMWLW